MQRVLLLLLLSGSLSWTPTARQEILRDSRESAGDLALGGELRGLPPAGTRYVRYEDLVQLPLETYTVADDPNFSGETQISGVPLATLIRLFADTGGPGSKDLMVVAICKDGYRAHFPQDYIEQHRPLLVLRIDGKDRDGWPAVEGGGRLGPYLISHPSFKPAFKVLSHEDEAQIPFGITELDFWRESVVFKAILPHGRTARFRCHNSGSEGGTLAGRSWGQLAADADGDGTRFRQIIRDPGSVMKGARMPPHSSYDDATLNALTAYFKTFAPLGRGR
jgi:hypothetical protein